MVIPRNQDQKEKAWGIRVVGSNLRREMGSGTLH